MKGNGERERGRERDVGERETGKMKRVSDRMGGWTEREREREREGDGERGEKREGGKLTHRTHSLYLQDVWQTWCSGL